MYIKRMRLLVKAFLTIQEMRVTMDAQQAVLEACQYKMAYQQQLIDSHELESARLQIEYSRWGRDVFARFLVALDSPQEQEEMRDFLHKALVDLSDEVARLEEKVV
jgi:hypothetical protein